MLAARTWRYITEYDLIRSGDTVFVGFSGGADSTCLLLLLRELGRIHGFSVWAVHVNHKLRGEESDGDQTFAEEFCREQEIPLRCFSFEVAAIADEEALGLEEAGRLARSRAFRICLEEQGGGRIALAHHRRDQAETVLFRMARGSYLTGLAGIRPRQGDVIHPLLFADKEEILQELKKRGVSFRTDSSNLTDAYTRNCIRHKILPVLEEKVNDRSLAHIAEAAEAIGEADQFLRELSLPVRDRCLVEHPERGLLVLEKLKEEPPLLQRYVLMDALEAVSGGRKNLGREQLLQLQDIFRGETGRRVCLPGEIEAVRSYDGMWICKAGRGSMADEEALSAKKIEIIGAGLYSLSDWRISCEILDSVPGEIPEKKFTKWLDYDKIKSGLEVRFRQPGDCLVVGKDGGRKKLKSYLIDEKIPADTRNAIPLLAAGSSVFWVIGHRISEDCKITAQTKVCIKITVWRMKNE